MTTNKNLATAILFLLFYGVVFYAFGWKGMLIAFLFGALTSVVGETEKLRKRIDTLERRHQDLVGKLFNG